MSNIIIKDGKYKLVILPYPKSEGERMNAFVMSPEGRAQVWLEPEVEISDTFYTRYNAEHLKEVLELAKKHSEELIQAWKS